MLWHSRLRIWHCLWGSVGLICILVQWVMDLALLQLRCRSQLRLWFDTWPGDFYMQWVQLKREGKKKGSLWLYSPLKNKIIPKYQYFMYDFHQIPCNTPNNSQTYTSTSKASIFLIWQVVPLICMARVWARTDLILWIPHMHLGLLLWVMYW